MYRLAFALGLSLFLAACGSGRDVAEPPHAYWTQAGVLYVAGGQPGSVRVLYARGGSMALVREVTVVPGRKIRALRFDPGRSVLWVYTDEEALALDALSMNTARAPVQLAQAREQARH